MARIFITGSADGLGLMAAGKLAEEGHKVVVHARNKARAAHATELVKTAEAVVIGDLSDIEQTKTVADQINAIGPCDTVIHNAGIYQAPSEQLFKVNTLAPYILTCLIHRPGRLIYLSSGMHLQGRPSFSQFSLNTKSISYSDTKLHVLLLAKAIAARWPNVHANAVDPGWVPTKMGGQSAPDDLTKGYETQVWLAVSNDDKAKVSGHYFHHQQIARHNPFSDDSTLQKELLIRCAEVTGVSFPD